MAMFELMRVRVQRISLVEWVADEADAPREGTEHRRRSVHPGFRAWLRLPA